MTKNKEMYPGFIDIKDAHLRFVTSDNIQNLENWKKLIKKKIHEIEKQDDEIYIIRLFNEILIKESVLDRIVHMEIDKETKKSNNRKRNSEKKKKIKKLEQALLQASRLKKNSIFEDLLVLEKKIDSLNINSLNTEITKILEKD